MTLTPVAARRAMQRVRVAVSGMPALLGDVVRAALAEQPEVEVAAGPADEPVDVVVFPAGAGIADDIIGAALYRHQPPRLVIIAADGSRAYHCTPCGELSPAALLAAVRGQT
jgi:hypothetical protein